MNYSEREMPQVDIIRKAMQDGLDYNCIVSMLDPEFIENHEDDMTMIKERCCEYKAEKERQEMLMRNRYATKVCDDIFGIDTSILFEKEIPIELVYLTAHIANNYNCKRFVSEVNSSIRRNIPKDIILRFLKISNGFHLTMHTLIHRYTKGDISEATLTMIESLLDVKDICIDIICDWILSNQPDELTQYIFYNGWNGRQINFLAEGVMKYNLKLGDILFIRKEVVDPYCIKYLLDTVHRGTYTEEVLAILANAYWLNSHELKMLRADLMKREPKNYEKVLKQYRPNPFSL